MPSHIADIDLLIPRFSHFIGVDSDGCVFDSMELKQKACFIPNIIDHYHLQAVATYAREVAEFVNLYSRQRGMNRFPALVAMLDMLRKRREVVEAEVEIPLLPATRDWLSREPRPCNLRLEAAVRRASGEAQAELSRLLEWSESVDHSIAARVSGLLPFPHVQESLAAAAQSADLMVISATPHDAIYREWSEAKLARHVLGMPGQEAGSKRDQLRSVIQRGYEPERVLLIGDAPGDWDAARANGARFYPITPGREQACWKRFHDEAMTRFLSDEYTDEYQRDCLKPFEDLLSAPPPWESL